MPQVDSEKPAWTHSVGLCPLLLHPLHGPRLRQGQAGFGEKQLVGKPAVSANHRKKTNLKLVQITGRESEL